MHPNQSIFVTRALNGGRSIDVHDIRTEHINFNHVFRTDEYTKDQFQIEIFFSRSIPLFPFSKWL